jgi:SPOR domain
MADRYQNRPFPADDPYDGGGDPHASGRNESDPLAELARLIGQTDPFAGMGRANQRVQPRIDPRDQDQYEPPVEMDDGAAVGPPPWMQRAVRQEASQQDYPSAAQPPQRYAAEHAAPEPDHHQAPPAFADIDQPVDPSRYDDALYGQLDAGVEESLQDPVYAEDAYAYQDDYRDGAGDQVQKRRSGMATAAVVLALAVVGTGAAFAYRSYVGSPRSGEPPIIRADTGPTKIMPAPDGTAKVPDRLAAGDGMEKIVPREEAPVDINARSGPRMVFPPLNQNANPPSVASVTPSGPPPASTGNGTLPNNEPHKIKTLSIRGDQPDGTATPVTSAPPAAVKPAPAARAAVAPGAATQRNPPAPATANANASANAPLSLSPQGSQPVAAAEPRTRVATTNNVAANPTQIAPSSGGGYLVQVSSQRNEADAQASYRVLQGKFPTVLGSRAPLIKRADLGDKGVYYRAMVGPFGSPDEASQFCGSLKTAGGQCVVQRN